MEALHYLEISPPGIAPQASIIWLHGLGADGHDFVPVMRALGLPDTIRFVFPHAPLRSVTINSGQMMRAWYDITDLDIAGHQDASGIRDSEQQIRRLLEREQSFGIAPRRILLGGFSQGGAIALHTGLRHTPALGGIIALSSYLPLAQSLAGEQTTDATSIPIFMAHGTSDPVIPLADSVVSARQLTDQGMDLRWHTYPMEHAVCNEEIADLRSFVAGVLGIE